MRHHHVQLRSGQFDVPHSDLKGIKEREEEGKREGRGEGRGEERRREVIGKGRRRWGERYSIVFSSCDEELSVVRPDRR